jgi:hypothetical protein
MSGMKLEQGKWYRAKNGEIGVCIGTAQDRPSDWLIRYGDKEVKYYGNGNMKSIGAGPYDIEAEHDPNKA